MTTPTLKQTPLYATASKFGANFTTQAGWQLAQDYGDVEAELAAARERVALTDVSANGKLLVEGQAAADLLPARWELPAFVGSGREVTVVRSPTDTIQHGETGETAPAYLFRLRPDQFLLSTLPGDEAHLLRELTPESNSELVHVTDITHGRAELRLIGPATAELLSRLCGLDFHPQVFPDLTAKQSSLAKTRQVIIRRDQNQLPAYTLIGARSLGPYLWETIMKAGRDLSIAPAGLAALESL